MRWAGTDVPPRRAGWWHVGRAVLVALSGVVVATMVATATGLLSGVGHLMFSIAGVTGRTPAAVLFVPALPNAIQYAVSRRGRRGPPRYGNGFHDRRHACERRSALKRRELPL